MTLYFVAGETSADNHGAALMSSLRRRDVDLNFIGRGGPQMRMIAGEKFKNWIENAAVVGLWEVIKKYVELGLGISIIMSIGITGEQKLEVIPAGEFFSSRAYGVVLRKGRILTPQAKRFIGMLLDRARITPGPDQSGA